MAHDDFRRRSPFSRPRCWRVAFAFSLPLAAIACLDQDDPTILRPGGPAAADGMAAAGGASEPPVNAAVAGAGAGAQPLGDDMAPPVAAAGAAATDAPGAGAAPGAGGAPAAGSVPPAAAGSGGTGGAGGVVPAAWTEAPALVDAVSLADDALASQALALLGGADGAGHCSSCHALGRPTLTRWQQLTTAFSEDCLAQPALPDVPAVDAMYACFEQHRRSNTGFAPSDFGIYAAATHLPWMTFVFDHATPTATDPNALQAFRSRVGMPRAGAPLSQAEFDVVAEWFARGLPGLFDLVPEESGEGCTAELAPPLAEHIDAMAADGWRARNEQVPLLMFGCDGDQTGSACLSALPAAVDQPYAGGWDVVPGTTIRILRDNSAAPTAYWSRSSPDGRFIASGLAAPDAANNLGQIVDLAQGKTIPGNFAYDATFFPDNSGFMVQRDQYAPALPGGLPTNGTPQAGGVAVACEQSVLLSSPAALTGEEPQCAALEGQVGLYEQLAKSLDGDDYWVVYGSYGEDDGGFHPVLENPAAAFQAQSSTTLVPMINQGNGFEAGTPVTVTTPLQGDPMLSPSGRLLITRLKGAERTVAVDGVNVVTAEQSGYALHLLSTTRDGDEWSASLEDVGRVCITGGKAVVSYDERWMILHHYTTAADAVELGFSGPDDPDFAEYTQLGSSNIYLVDLLTGDAQRITNVGAGQYALFPHFRSDGWIYFVVRTLDGQEYFAASDAALVAAGE